MTAKTQRLQIKLKGGGPWGFRLQGGSGTGVPLTVSKVRRRSKAYNNLHEGDLLLSVNGILCDHMTYDQVMAIADKTGSEFHLEVERNEIRSENHFDDAKSNAFSYSKIQPMKTTVTNSSMVKMTETETKVTKTDKTISNILNTLNLEELSPKEPTLGAKTVTIAENDSSLFDIRKTNPSTTSDYSTESIAEVTPQGQKFEKIETERLHEKQDNKDTTIVRTDYEECVRNTTVIPPVSTTTQITGQTSENDSDSKNTSDVYEIHKEKKYEISTSKINGSATSFTVGSLLNHSNGINECLEDFKKTVEMLENPLPFATPVAKFDLQMELDEQSDSSGGCKKKKMFSSSSFYEEPHAIYPTVEEQFEMAKKIAESLAADTNSKSKGANMFFKRAKRSTKWVHEGPEPSSESAPDTPEALPDYSLSERCSEASNSLKKFPKLKLVLDPRHPVDLMSLRSTGHNISEHNVISPEVCHGLARDLESPIGKGSALFAKRKKKSSEWIVDEEKVKALMKAHEQDLNLIKQSLSKVETPQTPMRSPWDTSMYVSNASRSKLVHPEELAETVIAAADKRRDSITHIEEQAYESCRSPIIPATPAASYYDIYRARAPKGWASTSPLSGVCSPPLSSEPSISFDHEANPFPPYATLTRQSHGPKFNFQNFNTLPRKWKAHN